MTVVDEICALMDELVAAVADDPTELSDCVSLEKLFRCSVRLEAVTARCGATFDKRRAWAPAGAKSASAWIAGTCRLPSTDVKRRLRLGRAMVHLPIAAEAWLAGDMAEPHMGLLWRARRPGTEAQLAAAEAKLVDIARRSHFRTFQQAMAYWMQAAAPEAAAADAESVHQQRRCHVSETFEGTIRGDFDLDPVGGAIVSETLKEIYDELFKADWADAKQRLGTEPTLDDLARTAPQRRADALVEMATRAKTAPKDGRRPRPLFSVYVNYGVMKRLCELANGTVIAPEQLVPWLAEAELERIVFDGKGRVLDVGPRRRLFRGATRRAVQLRDRKCFHPLCEERAENCQIDHTTEYADGGTTTIDNGEPACGFHNRWKHRTGRKPSPSDDAALFDVFEQDDGSDGSDGPDTPSEADEADEADGSDGDVSTD